MSETGLTDKQKQFCREYLKDFNGTAAYLRAGYSCTNKAARTSAHALLTKPNIQAFLSALRKQVERATEITIERTIEEIGRVAFSDVTLMLSFDSGGVTFKSSSELPSNVTAAIAQVKSVETTRYSDDGPETRIEMSAKLHNKMSALTLLADFFGIRDDFNKARASLRRYGLELAEDLGSELGWKLEKYANTTGADPSVESDRAAEEFFNSEDE